MRISSDFLRIVFFIHAFVFGTCFLIFHLRYFMCIEFSFWIFDLALTDGFSICSLIPIFLLWIFIGVSNLHVSICNVVAIFRVPISN